ncbi:MAG: NupC/NupG family nucleoside CNT transporter [Hyphomicrobiaceae bacterium]
MTLQLQSLAGLLALPALAWLLSEQRGAIGVTRGIRIVAMGLVLQIAIAALMLNVPPIRALFDWPARAVDALQGATNAGMRLVFGYLAGGPAPFAMVKPEASFVLALQALPIVLLMSVLSKLLYHWGVLQWVVKGFAWCLRRSMGVSGPVGTSAAANIFVGMVEAPLLVRPYLMGMSRAALFATMTVGMATIAGTMLAVYAGLLAAKLPGAAGHLIVASVISAPAALMISALMVPDPAAGDADRPSDDTDIVIADAPASSMDAIAQGTREGVDLLVNITAMLIVAVALVTLLNMALAAVAEPFGLSLTLERMLGWLMAPLAWLIGIPWQECGTAGSLLGVKTVLNEFLAYLQLAALPAEALSDRSRLILAYALCGFANMGSLGIMIGGLSAMVPQRRLEIVELGAKTIVSGTLATLLTGAVVGVLTA